jgi:hypothetical protein
MKLSPQNMLRLQQLISALSFFCLAVNVKYMNRNFGLCLALCGYDLYTLLYICAFYLFIRISIFCLSVFNFFPIAKYLFSVILPRFFYFFLFPSCINLIITLAIAPFFTIGHTFPIESHATFFPLSAKCHN